MMPWRKVVFPRERRLDQAVLLRSEFEQIFIAQGSPRDAALFGEIDIRPDMVLYFNPGAYRLAAALLDRWGAIECEAPGGSVSLLVGHKQALYDQRRAKE
jgi:hypothetical protein